MDSLQRFNYSLNRKSDSLLSREHQAVGTHQLVRVTMFCQCDSRALRTRSLQASNTVLTNFDKCLGWSTY